MEDNNAVQGINGTDGQDGMNSGGPTASSADNQQPQETPAEQHSATIDGAADHLANSNAEKFDGPGDKNDFKEGVKSKLDDVVNNGSSKDGLEKALGQLMKLLDKLDKKGAEKKGGKGQEDGGKGGGADQAKGPGGGEESDSADEPKNSKLQKLLQKLLKKMKPNDVKDLLKAANVPDADKMVNAAMQANQSENGGNSSGQSNQGSGGMGPANQVNGMG